jgi:hypothetical protein
MSLLHFTLGCVIVAVALAGHALLALVARTMALLQPRAL